jgi:hypothetical protein
MSISPSISGSMQASGSSFSPAATSTNRPSLHFAWICSRVAACVAQAATWSA